MKIYFIGIDREYMPFKPVLTGIRRYETDDDMEYTFECRGFDPHRTLFCGQAFRWRETDGVYSGISGGRYAELFDNGDGTFTLRNIEKEDIPYWRSYFDLDTDYDELVKRFSSDSHMRVACSENPGIRVLIQEPFETLISFIISQNNNIKRITGIIDRLCEQFGEKTDNGFLFPTEKQLYGITAEELAPLRAGFRAKYIADAMEKLESREVDLDSLYEKDTCTAREELKKIKGVGDKVADCVLLFAYHKTDAFPRDVWIKRVEQKLYPNGLPECIKGNEGIAQQFLFDYARTHNI